MLYRLAHERAVAPALGTLIDALHALGLVQYLRSIGYEAWIEDADGNAIEETVNACVPALQSKYESFTKFRVAETSQQPRTRWQEYAKAFVPKDCGR